VAYRKQVSGYQIIFCACIISALFKFISNCAEAVVPPTQRGVLQMLTKTLLAFCLLCAFVLVGCSKTDDTSTPNSNKTTTTTTTTSTTSTAPSGDKIGVPECDDFLAKYEACVSGKVPEMARGAFDTSMKQWRDSWKKLAANPQTKGTLAAACKQSAEQAKTSMKAYGCEF
jgi:hypothetical protein